MSFLLLLWPGVKASSSPLKPVASLRVFSWTNPVVSWTVPPSAVKKVGWMPEWGFHHDPEDLERRLRAQKESVFSPRWLDRFLAAEEKARRRIGKAKTAKHRAALEEAVEQVAARVSEAVDAGIAAPEGLIIELEAAAGAQRTAASLKHALVAIEMAQAILMEDEEILLLLD